MQPAAALTTPQPADVVFTSQDYHDYPDKFMGPTDPALLNKLCSPRSRRAAPMSTMSPGPTPAYATRTCCTASIRRS